jgi:hypothetical protein
MRLCFIVVLALSGCELYFEDPPEPPPGTVVPDAAVGGGGGGGGGGGNAGCPKPGTYAEILYPLDGATAVPQPVPIKMHVVIPNTLDGKGIYLSDASGAQVGLDHYDGTCSMQIPPIQTGPVQDVTWTECYKDLAPDATYTWHIWLTCYDASGIHELATSTFRTAP